MCILLPDKGSLTRYNLEDFGVPVLHATKHRDPETGRLSQFTVPALMPRVLIVDDICDGGGTFLGLADAIDFRTELYLYVTHGIFSKGVHELYKRFKAIYTTRSFK